MLLRVCACASLSTGMGSPGPNSSHGRRIGFSDDGDLASSGSSPSSSDGESGQGHEGSRKAATAGEEKQCVTPGALVCVCVTTCCPLSPGGSAQAHALANADVSEWLARKTSTSLVVEGGTGATQMPDVQDGYYTLLFRVLEYPLPFHIKLHVRCSCTHALVHAPASAPLHRPHTLPHLAGPCIVWVGVVGGPHGRRGSS